MTNDDMSKSAAEDLAAAEAELKLAQERLEAAQAKMDQMGAAEPEVVEATAQPIASEAAMPAEQPQPVAQDPNWAPYGAAPSAASYEQPVNSYVQPDPTYAQQPANPYYAAPQPNAAQTPPQQPYYAPQQSYGEQQGYYQQPYAQPVVNTKDHVAAGLLAIFLGSLGIHKFYLGYNTSGFIMLAVTVIGSLITFGLAAAVMQIIALIEGILYLTKSQSEFEQFYVFSKREWF